MFLTNNFDLPVLTIANIYRSRWQVELFFRWIKQHLRIKSFYGTSPNAVKTQVWIAIGIYVLVAIIRKELKVEHSLHEILQILRVTLFEKTPINEALSPENPSTAKGDVTTAFWQGTCNRTALHQVGKRPGKEALSGGPSPDDRYWLWSSRSVLRGVFCEITRILRTDSRDDA